MLGLYAGLTLGLGEQNENAQYEIVGYWNLLETSTQTVRSVIAISLENRRAADVNDADSTSEKQGVKFIGKVVSHYHSEAPNVLIFCDHFSGENRNKPRGWVFLDYLKHRSQMIKQGVLF